MPTNTIRLPLSALIFLFVVLLCVAIGGGFLSARLFRSQLPLRSDVNGTIVPVSQQVTISPSKLATDIASTHGKSTFLLANENTKGITALGTGVALTNDGIIMSVIPKNEEPVVGIGEDGIVFPLTTIGYDELSGISFYKISDRIVIPFNVSQSALRVGSSLLALYRQKDTAQITAHPVTFSAPLLPSKTTAPGIQKIASIVSETPMPPGAALLDENGNLAGVLLDPINNTGMFVSDIRSALERLSSNQLSYNPYISLGLTVNWNTNLDTNRTLRVTSVVTSITNNSPADNAGLQVGDVLTAIAGNTVSWDTNLVETLRAHPVNLAILRNEEQRQISINP